MNILGVPTLTEIGYDHHVRIWGWHYATKRDLTIPEWDEISIYAIERFGLPGDRYITDIGPERMKWSFRDPRDALMFKLRWSEVAR
jgi:hypothetical protein